MKCQKITAYYSGTFQNEDRSWEFDADLEITAEINLANKRLYFKFVKFNANYTEGYYFYLSNGTDNIK